MKVRRFPGNPIIWPHMDDRIGDNINGPSVIRVPDWVPNALGRYYLYFAHHQGSYIRMAYADRLHGPWQLHRPGVLNLSQSHFDEHLASPDAHVLEGSREIRLYYHGCYASGTPDQQTRVATSTDGLHFDAQPAVLGEAYWRAFHWDGFWYTLEMPGVFRRSRNGVSDFEQGPTLFTEHMRHSAVLRRNNTLYVFYSNAQDCPERILWASINLRTDWRRWTATEPKTLLAPELAWEGANCPPLPSERGSVHHPVNQLRDPGVFEDNGCVYLLYSGAGERGIGIGALAL